MPTEYDTIASECPACGVTFRQLRDPGRRRAFCSNACRQRDYRARKNVSGNEARERARRQEEARREQDAQRARERRARQRAEEAARSGVSWTRPNPDDTAAQARNRARCRKLLDRANHARTDPNEATACQEKAQKIRKTYNL